MRYVIAVLLCLTAAPAAAQKLYKCEAKGQPPSYQSAPCAARHRQVKTWDATPEPASSNADRWRAYYRRKQAAEDSAYLSNLAGTARRSHGQAAVISPRTKPASACSQARKGRDIALGPNNQGGNVDTRRYWNDQVHKHC